MGQQSGERLSLLFHFQTRFLNSASASSNYFLLSTYYMPTIVLVLHMYPLLNLTQSGNGGAIIFPFLLVGKPNFDRLN